MRQGTALKLVIAGMIAAALAMGGAAHAQTYPAREIRVIVGLPAGSGGDVVARYYADKLSRLAGKPVIVENKPGMILSLGADAVAKAPPDGHTILVTSVTSSHAANVFNFKKLPYDPIKDFTPVALLHRSYFMLMVRADAPWTTVVELTEAMKKKGDKASYATIANPGVIMGAIYRNVAGLSGIDVPYRTGPESLNELLSGRIDYAIHDPIFALAQAREGRIRILAVSTGKRLLSQPDIPTMTESGIPMDLSLWWGVMVPSATPRPIVDKINGWFSQIVSAPETKKFLADSGADPLINTPEKAQEMFQTAIKEWGEYVRIAKIPQI